jgi:8-oxo-dGTP diphosphatase
MKLATLCYIRREGQTLMLHRIKKANDMHQGKWNGLGGKLNPGETPEECVVREIYEESGLLMRNPQLKGFLTFPAFTKNEDWYVFVFVAEDFEGELIDSPEGDLRWVDNSDLPRLNLWEGDAIFLPWLERRGIFSGKFIYKDGRLVLHEVAFYGDD